MTKNNQSIRRNYTKWTANSKKIHFQGIPGNSEIQGFPGFPGG